MKQTKSIPEATIMSNHHQFAQNLIKKKLKKQFELLYRERDQSAQENPMESIIFVKSKTCKPKNTSKKIKVQQEFNKIMKDLDDHINQHKKNKSSEKKSYSPNSTQMKATSSSKKQTKQSDFISKKSKNTQKDFNKVFKTVNKGNDMIAKQKIQKSFVKKSPNKSEKTHLSPKSKRILSPKSPNFEKQNFLSRKFNQTKINCNKSPNNKKSTRKGYVNVTQSDESFNQFKENKKADLKRNIRPIPLKVEEYIFLEDNFELIKQKSLVKLQTKLLSTYRDNNRQFQNRLGLKQKQLKKQNISQKFQQSQQRENYLNYFDQEPSVCSQEEKSQFNLESQNEIKDFKLTNPQVIDEIIRKITCIQQWWRRVLKIQNIEKYLNQKKRTIIESLQEENQKNTTTPINLTSAKSITFNEESQQNVQNQENQEMTMLKNQNEIVKQKKNMHQKILQNLLKDNKITQDQFEAKLKAVQQQYEKQLKDIMSLYKLCEGQFQEQNNQEVKIIQGKKSATSTQSVDQNEQQDSQQNSNEVEVKIYKIGDKITTEMQSYIQNAKKNKEASLQMQKNQFISDKYNIKTDQQGEQYYEDFEPEQSSQGSPKKVLEASNFDQFQANIDTNSNGVFEPNTNFMQLLQEYKQQQQIKSRMEQRIGIQMGALKIENQNELSIDTSILGIHQFLVNFFKFYLYYYKDEFLRFINMPYGYQPEKRLKFIQGYEDQSEDLGEDDDGIIYGLEYIISDDVFQEFIDQYYGPSLKQADEKQKAIIQCSKMHDKAVFECFNEALNYFRPYYSIGGPPYIWNCSEKTLTFYFIAEQNIQEVFEKTEFRVMKWASALLGLYVPELDNMKSNSNKNLSNGQNSKNQNAPQILQNNQSNCHPMIAQNRQDRLIKQERLEVTQTMSKWSEIQQQKTSTLYQLGSMILEELVAEFGAQFLLNIRF